MADDIELGEIPNPKRSSWKTFMDDSKVVRRSSTFNSTAAGRSPSVESQLPDNLPKLTYEESQCQERLISFIVGDDIQKGSLQRACQWYSRHLQMRFKETWHLLAPSLVGLVDNSSEPRPGDLAIVYKFVLEVGRLLSVKDIALVEFVDELDNNNLLKPQMDGERAKPNQIVFAAIGWLTMFYEVVPNPSADSLEVETTSTCSSGLRNAVVTRKFSSYRQSFERIAQPLEIMLGDFGCLIPMPRIHPLHQQLLYGNQQGEDIMVHSICFKTLQQIAGLGIELANSLNLHLELDSERKTLKLFKYPSFCRIMMIDRKGDRKGHILSRLLNDHAKRLFEDINPPDIKPALLFEEILRSYRLIFGQDERSWKAFSKILTKLEEDQGQGRSISACDPLLRVLCGQSCASPEARAIYEEIDVHRGAIPDEQTTHCNLYTEFSFFGTRLLELQRFDRRCQPQTVRSTQGDKLDIAPWFTQRNKPLLVFLTTFTILLLVVVLGLQIWQTMLLKQELEQGQGTTSTS